MASLDEVQCHFMWLTDEDLEGHDVSKTVQSLEGEPDYEGVKVMKKSLVAFLKTRVENPDLEEALKEAEEAIVVCQDPAMDEDPCRLCGYELIALGNKAYIQEMMGDDDGKEKTLKLIQTLREEDLDTAKKVKDDPAVDDKKDNTSATEEAKDSKDDDVSETINERKTKIFEACNAGVHAYALYELGLNQESLVLFRNAEDLDPECYHWPMGRGVVAGRLQRRQKRMGEEPHILKQLDAEQEESLQRAVELTQNKCHITLVRLGDVYFFRGRGNPRDPNTQDKELLKKAEKLLLQAYEIHPNSSVLLKRLGKVLVEIDRNKHEEFAEECLLKAHELDPTNSMTLHRLGQFYEHASESRRDLHKAEEYYRRAVVSGSTRNLAAEFDLGRVRKKQDRSYNSQKHFEDMMTKYPSEEDQIVIRERLDQMRQNQLNRRMRNLRF